MDAIKLPTKEEEEKFLNYVELIHERIEAVRIFKTESNSSL
jgi:hypothetical protein